MQYHLKDILKIEYNLIIYNIICLKYKNLMGIGDWVRYYMD